MDTDTKAKPFDFEDGDTTAMSEHPFEFELLHYETDEPLGVFIEVIGTESNVFKDYIRRRENTQRKRDFEAARKGKNAHVQTFEEDEQNAVEMFAALVTGWATVVNGKREPVIMWQGKPLQFSRTNLEWWLAKFPWARKQIDKQSTDISNFTKGLSKASPPLQPTSSN